MSFMFLGVPSIYTNNFRSPNTHTTLTLSAKQKFRYIHSVTSTINFYF